METKAEAGPTMAEDVASYLHGVLERQDEARIVVATGASQFEFLDRLCRAPGIDWGRITMFHLDEYVGLPVDHPASFRRYLRERLIERVHPGTVVLIDGEADPVMECRRVGDAIRAAPIDVAFVGIGENGHLAFNDPPADFETTEPYIVVRLDEACRRQQVGEGWFGSVNDVPVEAISMSIHQIMLARKIFCLAPEERKAEAVRACFAGEVTPWAPASILQRHRDVDLYLDRESASLLPLEVIQRASS
ncbi:MAG TPA: glucosamine-6-phosphate deaminase [Chloroflexota bacterium]|nr:glucosamine-6-phosphate deaminase [Chloroflexota bacterium]